MSTNGSSSGRAHMSHFSSTHPSATGSSSAQSSHRGSYPPPSSPLQPGPLSSRHAFSPSVRSSLGQEMCEMPVAPMPSKQMPLLSAELPKRQGNSSGKRSRGSSCSSYDPEVVKRTKMEHTYMLTTEIKRLLTYLERLPNLYSHLPLIHKPFSTSSSPIRWAQDNFCNIVGLGLDPVNLTVEKFAVDSPRRVVNLIKSLTLNVPSWAELQASGNYKEYFPDPVTPDGDSAAKLKQLMEQCQTETLRLADQIDALDFPTEDGQIAPWKFGKRCGWNKMQNTDLAIMCHRPGINRPSIPVNLMHTAFYQFFKVTTSDGKALKDFRMVANELSTALTAYYPLEDHRADEIKRILTKVFPNTHEYEWKKEKSTDKCRIDLVYQRILDPKRYKQRFGSNPVQNTVLILIEIKLEAGTSGDAYMQACRYYDILAKGTPAGHLTGIPIFLMAISGPNVQIAGCWRDGKKSLVDPFESFYVCQDVARKHREHLAKSLYSLRNAVDALPSCHITRDRAVREGTPNIFTDFTPTGTNELVKFELQSPFDAGPNTRNTVFNAMIGGTLHCLAKLTFWPYGFRVHEFLAREGYAPSVIGCSSRPEVGAQVWLMDLLSPPTTGTPGWIPLSEIWDLAKYPDILVELLIVVGLLEGEGFVHGDLRANNIMIDVDNNIRKRPTTPLKISIVDFEWAGIAGEVYYPDDRNKAVGYPGEPAGPIGRRHDRMLVEQWWSSLPTFAGSTDG